MLFWVAVTELLGAAALPSLRAYFGNRRDAALLSRPIGLAATALTGWALAVLFTGRFNRATLLVAFLAVAGAGFLVNRFRLPTSGPRKSSPPSSSGR